MIVAILLMIMVLWYALFAAMSWQLNPFKWTSGVAVAFYIAEMATIAISFPLLDDKNKEGDSEC